MKRIKKIDEWRELLEGSDTQPFLLFKSSMTSISSLAAKKELDGLRTELPIYIVITQISKKLSATIESDLGVPHEVPQLLIVKDKRGIWQATHYQIKEQILVEAVKEYV
ncbi:general stress protein [Sporosarcina sp. P26b]|uniref:monothiol bacilliredoxin BrxC family protein n=1 Tax=Sporosarcina sp. P26b TaxID=2048253 RepID=UPI000C16C849|nr:monothiol bacilliredoxin BrxC family protein [Sporosarcina sp. P26b]PIC97486.1 general stress protein [Sporosarcina sp. P26b]